MGLLALSAIATTASAQLTFSPTTNFAADVNTRSVTSADFNGDGIRDLASANAGADNLSVLLGTGTGSFRAATN
jgi:hypothetical protein